ncbi:hypothetical protein DYB32_003894 [Aphanomyces invadans]|uniref:Magnesium transporter n=1 Tax=Aphanomyces invadans TaxID=157072 RepID=A0A418AZA2_9STRA|nr:hypothetical protein DYB32_003894 [Aphanomyces invadans]
MGCEERSTQTYSLWYVGVIMSVGASVCTNMGVNLQKYSFMRECKKPTATKRGYIRQPLWMLGGLGDFGALGFIPQSLATPVGGSTIVANVFFAHKFLHEVFTRRDGIGTALILTGIVVVAAFADKSNGCHTLDQLIALYGQPAFIAYVVLVSVTMAVVYIFVRRIRSIVATCGKNSKQYRRFFHSLANPALSGVFGAQSVLLAKSVAELIKSTIAGDNQFTTVGTYAIALGMFGCIFLQKCKGLKYQWVALSSLEQNVKQAAMKSTLSLSKLKSSSIHPIHVSTTPSDAGFQLNVSASTK